MIQKQPRKYDLKERTALFGESVILFSKSLNRTPITTPLISQLVRAATSVGANYCEADNAESAADFKHKIGICRKEANESKHFLRMIAKAENGMKEKVVVLWYEADELHKIFNTIYTKMSPK